MPSRDWCPGQDWLLPLPGDLLPADHLVRFVAEFAPELNLTELAISAWAAPESNPPYHPR